MNTNEFKVHGKDMVDYICQYMETLDTRSVKPNVEPGYLRKLLPTHAPEESEPWENIMDDVEKKIMPGITHWQHPRFHAYFPSGNSFPSILGDMLSDGIGCIGFSWDASPACTELETVVLDWFGKALGLPNSFLSCTDGGKGGGVIQSSASECIFVSMLAARAHALQQLKEKYPNTEDGVLLTKLVAYCSSEAHSCVEKAAMLSLVKLRLLDTDENCSMRGKIVEEAMQKDIDNGLVPFFVSCTLGTTSTCAFDNVAEIGPVCHEFDVWMHIDGAYAGNAFICPEFQYLHRGGMEYASSFNTNPNKWLLTNFDISCMWVQDRFKLTQSMIVNPLYLQHANEEETIDYRHWGIPLSRRFRALKLWFVMRSFGLNGLRSYIRNHCKLAKKFEELVLKDDRFEVVNEVKMGLVCFRLNGTDLLNGDLLSRINQSGKLHMIPSRIKGRYIIRFCVVAENANEADIEHAWEVISHMASELLDSSKIKTPIDVEIEQTKLRRRLSKRFSFTRSLSREVLQKKLSHPSLKDGVSPIDVLDETLDNNVFKYPAPINEDKQCSVIQLKDTMTTIDERTQ